MYNGRVLTRKIDTQRGEGSTSTWYILEGAEGAVQFLILFTDGFKPLPADVGYHARTPVHGHETPMASCPTLDGDYCYYDGSGLLAQDLYAKFKAAGDDPEVIWQELEAFYNDTFR